MKWFGIHSIISYNFTQCEPKTTNMFCLIDYKWGNGQSLTFVAELFLKTEAVDEIFSVYTLPDHLVNVQSDVLVNESTTSIAVLTLGGLVGYTVCMLCRESWVLILQNSCFEEATLLTHVMEMASSQMWEASLIWMKPQNQRRRASTLQIS